MTRIAMISEHASPLAALGGVDSGGQNVYVAQLARGIARRGFEVDVFTRRDHPDLPEVVQVAEGVRVVHLAAGPPAAIPKEELLPHMPEFTARLLRFALEQRAPYGLAHANFFMSGLAAAELKRALGVPYVVTFHALGRVRRAWQGDADRFPDERFEVEERVAREADRVIAECPQDAEDLVTLYGADPGRLTLIPCGFDPAEFRPVPRAVARARLGLAAHDRVVLQLGRMVPRKGVDNVIRALALLPADLPAKLLVVGGDADPASCGELARLRAVAREEGVAERVIFAGPKARAELRYCYAAADLFVTTPWYEPFGITPLEAMACGTPVVGAAVGGISYTVRHGETGLLVPPRDPAALARAVTRLLGDEPLARRLANRARRWVHQRFTWDRVCDEAADLYHRLVQPAVASQVARPPGHGFVAPTGDPGRGR